jgi:sulfur-oxidizing protein SoxY
VLVLAQVGLLDPALAAIIPPPVRTFESALEEIGGQPARSSEIEVTLPPLIEDGRSVPVTVSTRLAAVSEIFVLSEVNPEPLAIGCRVTQRTLPALSTRIKLAGSGKVYGVVRAGDRLYWASKDAAVARGGC